MLHIPKTQTEEKDNVKPCPIQPLRDLHHSIIHSIDHLQNLNVKFKSKQENEFLQTFMKVMDKMSNEIVRMEHKYDNIEKEVEADEKYIKLSTQLKFFSGECIELRRELNQTQEKLNNQTEANKRLAKENSILSQALFKKSKQAQKYRSRALSLSRKDTDYQNQIIRGSTQTQVGKKQKKPQFMSCIKIGKKNSLDIREDPASPYARTTHSSAIHQKRFSITKKMRINKTFIENSQKIDEAVINEQKQP